MNLPPYKTHGLLLSPDLVTANMANQVPNDVNPQRKGETRRDIGLEKVNENPDKFWIATKQVTIGKDLRRSISFGFGIENNPAVNLYVKCHYGVPGDLIYFKEQHYCLGFWQQTNELTKTKKVPKLEFVASPQHKPRFAGDEPSDYETEITLDTMGWYKRPSLFMPRAYARQWAMITALHVERLQDITERAAINEGIEPMGVKMDASGLLYKDYSYKYEIPGRVRATTCPIHSFSTMIDHANKPGTWAKNPWVWVVSYKPLSYDGRPSEDAITQARTPLFAELEYQEAIKKLKFKVNVVPA